TVSGVTLRVTGSTSANTGRAPARRMARAVKAAVRGEVITSSPAARPSASRASWIASVPLTTAMACRAWSEAASSRSKASPSGPRMNQPESRTRATAASISGRKAATCALRSPKGTAVMSGTPRSKVMPGVLAVVIDGAAEPVPQRHLGLPAERLPDLGRIRVEVSDVDLLAVGGEGHEAIGAASSRQLDQHLRDVDEGDGGLAAEVEDLAVRRLHRARPQQRVHHVVHVVEVALLLAVPEELDLLAAHRLPDEPADESLAVVLDELARSVGVGEAQRGAADAVHGVVDEVVELAGDLVDAVDVRGVEQMGLVHGQPHGLAVDLARPRVDDLHSGVV